MKLFDETKISSVADARRRAPVTILVDNKKLQGKFHLISQQVQGGSDVQIDKTFSSAILVTSFGQKLLPMSLMCIALPDGMCPDAAESASGVNERSLATLYQNNHAGRRNSEGDIVRIKVSFDQVVFDGILVGITQAPHSLSDGADLDIFRYTLTIQGNFA